MCKLLMQTGRRQGIEGVRSDLYDPRHAIRIVNKKTKSRKKGSGGGEKAP